MHVTRELITPEKAAQYLLRNNTRNRNISRTHVNRLAQSITDGKWVESHQGIAFYEDETLADGQHRLSAIVKAGVAVEMLVTRALPLGSETAVDQQFRPRTLGDSLVMEGVDDAKFHVAVSRHWLVLQGVFTPPNHVIREFNVKHCVAITTAKRLSRGHQTLKHASVSTVLAIAIERGHEESVAKWCEVIITGVASESQSAAIRFRDYWNTGPKRGGTVARVEWSKRVYASLRAFVEGRPLSRLYAAESIDWLKE